MSPSKRPFVVFGFASVHDTLEAEDVLRAAGVPSATVPSPRELGALCGIALRVERAGGEAAERALVAGGAPPKARAAITDF